MNGKEEQAVNNAAVGAAKEVLKVAIYARVSPTRKVTGESGMATSIEQQIEKCNTYAKAMGCEVVKTYVDEYRSGKAHEYMHAFRKMLEDAQQNPNLFTYIYCSRISRFGRNSLEGLQAVEEFKKLNITIRFIEENLDTEGGPIARAFMQIWMSFAEWQRNEVVENTSRGRLAALERGVKFGRKRKQLDRETLVALRKSSSPPMSYTRIASKLNVSTGTIINRFKELGMYEPVFKKIVEEAHADG